MFRWVSRTQVPLASLQVEEQRARGVGIVGYVLLAARELPDEPGVDRPEQQMALLGVFLRAGYVVENPPDLRRGEVRVDDETGLLAELLIETAATQCRADVRGTPALPHDGVVHGLAGALVPHNRRLALVGDSDGSQGIGVDTAVLQRLPHGCKGRCPDLLGVVLDPAGLRIMLRKL